MFVAGGILSPHLLSWQQGGVDFLLAESVVPPELSLCHALPRQAEARPEAQRPPTRPPAQPRPQARPETRPAAGAAPSPGQFRPASQAARPAPQAQASAGQSSSPAPSPSVSSVPPDGPLLAPELWPRPWRERLKATRPAPVLWTYWALGQDLYGAANAQRRDLLKRLLGDLQHPGGTHSFWPAALPSPQDWERLTAAGAEHGPVELHAHAAAFWAGVDMLKARALVVMGSPAVKALELPPRLRPFHQTRHKGKLVVVLRDVDTLVEEPHHYDAVREFLRRALEPFGQRG